jgi:adenylylsulfate kinase
MSKIYNFIGQPGAGKTTLAKHLKAYLFSKYFPNCDDIVLIDGDDIRDIFKNKDYSENGRRINIQRAYDIATFLYAKGYIVIVSLVSPYLDLREYFKKNENVVEIYIHTSNIRGKEKYHVSNFEVPLSNYIDVDTTDMPEVSSLLKITDYINKIGEY